MTTARSWVSKVRSRAELLPHGDVGTPERVQSEVAFAGCQATQYRRISEAILSTRIRSAAGYTTHRPGPARKATAERVIVLAYVRAWRQEQLGGGDDLLDARFGKMALTKRSFIPVIPL